MIRIVLTDQTVQIAGPDTELRQIERFETYDDQSLCFSKGGYDPRRLKHVPLMRTVRGVLVGYAGLAKEIMLFCKKTGIAVESFEDKREHFSFQKKEYSYDELRKYFNPDFKYVDHQIKALRTMIGHNKAIIAAPTSAGKSSIFSAFMRLTGLPTLVVVDRATLGAQIADNLRSDGIDCGFCSGSGVRQGFCMVSTIQSVRKIQDLPRFKCVVCDECHKDSARTFQEFHASFGCPLKYGFSASPSNGNMLDFARIRQHLGSVEIQVHAEELMEHEVMAKAKIYMVRCPAVMDAFDYQSAYDLNIIHNERRNRIIADIAEMHREEGYICILINNIEHGEILEEMIPGSVFLKGENNLESRLKALEDFKAGRINTLIATKILNEGISLTEMRTLIMAGGQKSSTQTIQKIGRVLRISSEKKQGVFYDFIDEDKRWLYRHSKQRLALYKKEGYNDITLLDENLEEVGNEHKASKR